MIDTPKSIHWIEKTKSQGVDILPYYYVVPRPDQKFTQLCTLCELCHRLCVIYGSFIIDTPNGVNTD